MADTEILARVERDFTLHPPATPEAAQQMDFIRAAFRAMAKLVAGELPAGREQALSLTHLEEACFFAIAALARNQEAPA
jgi:hypothetical protein